MHTHITVGVSMVSLTGITLTGVTKGVLTLEGVTGRRHDRCATGAPRRAGNRSVLASRQIVYLAIVLVYRACVVYCIPT